MAEKLAAAASEVQTPRAATPETTELLSQSPAGPPAGPPPTPADDGEGGDRRRFRMQSASSSPDHVEAHTVMYLTEPLHYRKWPKRLREELEDASQRIPAWNLAAQQALMESTEPQGPETYESTPLVSPQFPERIYAGPDESLAGPAPRNGWGDAENEVENQAVATNVDGDEAGSDSDLDGPWDEPRRVDGHPPVTLEGFKTTSLEHLELSANANELSEQLQADVYQLKLAARGTDYLERAVAQLEIDAHMVVEVARKLEHRVGFLERRNGRRAPIDSDLAFMYGLKNRISTLERLLTEGPDANIPVNDADQEYMREAMRNFGFEYH